MVTLKSQGFLQIISRLSGLFLKASVLWTTAFINLQEHMAVEENFCACFSLFSLVQTNLLDSISVSCYIARNLEVWDFSLQTWSLCHFSSKLSAPGIVSFLSSPLIVSERPFLLQKINPLFYQAGIAITD